MTARADAPPSRWLLVLTIAVVTAFTILRLVFAARLDFRSDEAYYWTWSRQAVLSFLDQPPMVAWFERLGQFFFGDTTLGARFAQILALPMIQFLLADIARRRTGSWNAALFVVLMLECTLYYALIVTIVEPSIPLLLFLSLALWALCRLDETMDPRWWLLIGVAGGLALQSKYIALLLAPAVLVFLLSAKHRRWLATVWPYLAILIALALFSPVLIWNARHNWESFAFQGVRLGSGHAPSIADLFRFLLYDTLSAGLLLVPIAVVGAVVLIVRTRQPFERAVAVAFLFPLAFFLIRSLGFQINQSWAYFMWPPGILSLALILPWGKRWAIAPIAAVALPGLPLVAASFFHGIADTSVWFGRGDFFGQDAGFADMSNDVLAKARETGATWIATSEYRTYANLLWHIGDQIPVVQVNERARFLDFAPSDPAQFTGKALYVHLAAPTPIIPEAQRTPLETLSIAWRGVPMQKIAVDTLEDFTPILDPPSGSPAYIWKN